ncbi:PRC-barrel domain-containing protein [Merismopedia glauca]|uniref:PRC-barrel domain-containing protein n=1 Tax=Merismopedia glauca CCAP 1448/3 TaxID=1296344 RepID=A0A2T1C9H1_9CYAN|nr:PRC-barrel domain-containing protein [Merismopedia glauca]PSB04884.1 hypothetical protein C7B64_02000 [Merismopedia glauca CCAP 1448/3]
MLKGSDLIGRLVVSYDTGERITRIKDLIFDQDSNRLLGFLVDEGGLFHSAKVIPFESIQAIGMSAVVVPSRNNIVSTSETPKIQELIRIDNVLKGTRIMTINGRDLGTMVDLYFDESSGRVEGYEASGGLFADAYSGRSFVPAPQALKIGEDVAFVPVETAQLMEEQTGGIKGAIQSAGDKIQETSDLAGQKLETAAQTTREQLQAASETAGEKLQETAATANQRLQRTAALSRQKLEAAARIAATSITNTLVDPKAQKMLVIGKTAKQEVITSEGIIIAEQGSLITPAIADLAERFDALDRLYRATGGDLTVGANAKLLETTNVTSEKLAEIAAIVTNRLESTTGYTGAKLSQFVRSTTAGLTDAIVEPNEQKALIIGKIVDRNVVAPDGKLIALEGQQVTFYMTELAQEKGALDQLFRAAGGSVTNELSRAADNLLANLMLDQTIGRRVHRTIWSENGSAIAVSGQIVTQNLVDRVRNSGKQALLLDAVGLTPDLAFRQNANQSLAQTGDRFQQGAVELQEQANTFWENLKEKFTQYTERTAQAIEERRIKYALGRPVNRVIFDQQDRIILNVGDLVTHRAIAQARQADLLDVLLSSVYTPNVMHRVQSSLPPAPINSLHLPVQGELILNSKIANGLPSS